MYERSFELLNGDFEPRNEAGVCKAGADRIAEQIWGFSRDAGEPHTGKGTLVAGVPQSEVERRFDPEAISCALVRAACGFGSALKLPRTIAEFAELFGIFLPTLRK